MPAVNTRKHHQSSAILSLLACLAWLSLAFEAVPAASTKGPRLNTEVARGFAALRRSHWKRAQAHFEQAVKLFDDELRPSSDSTPNRHQTATESLMPSDKGRRLELMQLNNYWSEMGARQSIYTFTCFTAALAGDERAARYFEMARGMRGPLWGRSCDEWAIRIHRSFFATLPRSNSPGYGRLLAYAGQLLLDAGKPKAIGLIRQAWRLAPDDPTVAAMLASYDVMHNRPGSARNEARASLASKPDQVSVLIDLATAEWVLASSVPRASGTALQHLSAAEAAARRAMTLDPSLPGPHATLAFVNLEKGDTAVAVREAKEALGLREHEPFFETVLAACLEASGNRQRARELMKKAWSGRCPQDWELRRWFFRARPLEYALQIHCT